MRSIRSGFTVSPGRDSWRLINREEGPSDMTSSRTLVTPTAGGAQVLAAFNTARTGTIRPQRDPQADGILKQLNQGRFKACEHLITVGFNLLDRGAPLEQVEEPGHRFIALMRSHFTGLYGEVDTVGRTLGTLTLAERLAHAEREVKLALFIDSRSYYSATQLLTAAGVYERANARFVDFIRQKAVETEGPALAVSRTT